MRTLADTILRTIGRPFRLESRDGCGYQEAQAFLEANSAALDVLRAAKGTP